MDPTDSLRMVGARTVKGEVSFEGVRLPRSLPAGEYILSIADETPGLEVGAGRLEGIELRLAVA